MTYFTTFELPPGAGFRLVAEQRIGTFFSVRQADGTRRLVEVHTPAPWNNPPPKVGEYTTEEEIQRIVRSVDIEV